MTVMRRLVTLLIVFAPPLAAQRASLATLSWFNGCWEAKSATRQIIERWELAGSEMKGMSRTIANGVPREPERLKIFVAGDSLVYGGEPPGQAYAEFRAASASDREVVFTNPKHDFPKKITYTRAGADSVIAVVEGEPGSRQRPLTYPYKRVACTPDTPTPGEIVMDELAPRYADLDAKELAAGSGTNAWMVEHAMPGFQFISWTGAGRTASAATAEQLARAVEGARNSPAAGALRDRVHTLRIDRLHLQGDTASVHVTVNRSSKFPDASANYGPAGEYHESRTVQRRIDKWIKVSGAWKLRESAIVGTELYVDGRIRSRDGAAVTPQS